MKIVNQVVTLFLAQQALTASAFAPQPVAFSVKNTALNYKINEAKQFEEEQLTQQADLSALKKMAKPPAPANTAKRAPLEAPERAKAKAYIGGNSTPIAGGLR